MDVSIRDLFPESAAVTPGGNGAVQDSGHVDTGNCAQVTPRHSLEGYCVSDQARPPDYRHDVACHLLAGHRVPAFLSDDWVGRARDFLAGQNREDDPATHAVRQAYDLRRRGPFWRRLEVEARLLAGEPFDQVAAKSGVGRAVVEAYEALFFAVTAVLHCRGHVCHTVIGLHRPGAGADLATQVKSFAYRGGPHVLDALLTLLRPPEPGPPPGPFVDRLTALRFKAQLLLEMTPSTDANAGMVVRAMLPLLRRARAKPFHPDRPLHVTSDGTWRQLLQQEGPARAARSGAA